MKNSLQGLMFICLIAFGGSSTLSAIGDIYQDVFEADNYIDIGDYIDAGNTMGSQEIYYQDDFSTNYDTIAPIDDAGYYDTNYYIESENLMPYAGEYSYEDPYAADINYVDYQDYQSSDPYEAFPSAPDAGVLGLDF